MLCGGVQGWEVVETSEESLLIVGDDTHIRDDTVFALGFETEEIEDIALTGSVVVRGNDLSFSHAFLTDFTGLNSWAWEFFIFQWLQDNFHTDNVLTFVFGAIEGDFPDLLVDGRV